MRIARDDVLRRIGAWLVQAGFQKAGATQYTRASQTGTWCIGFQKLSSGRTVRVLCSLNVRDSTAANATGPLSDPYGSPTSPNGIKYQFRWSTHEEDIRRCAEEYRRYIEDVVLPWFNQAEASLGA